MKPALLFSSLFLLNTANADIMWRWFDGKEMDYWKQGNKVVDHFASSPKPRNEGCHVETGSIRSHDAEPFRWEDYDNPSSPVFWDDGGDYIPPRPLRVLAADPTKENLEKYLSWQRNKIKASQTVSRMVAEANLQEPIVAPNLSKQSEGPDAKQVPWRKLRMIYFYRSNCPFCIKQKPIIEKLKSFGANIVAVQIDHESGSPLHEGSVPATSHDFDVFKISQTPTFFVAGKDRVQKWEGFLSLRDIVGLAMKVL